MPDYSAMTVADLTFLTSSEVELIDCTASDGGVIKAARVSVHGAGTYEAGPTETQGLIRHMMKNRHGSVFEHNSFTFRIYTPIFVHREFMTHRHISKNSESARYRELEPVFWVPAEDRRLVQEGKPAAYRLVDGTKVQQLTTVDIIKSNSYRAYWDYRSLLSIGVAREVARTVLPVNIFTSFYATMNARALMHFISLRVDDVDNAVPTHPLMEIQQVARDMEWHFGRRMPATYDAFVANGRVAP